MSNELIEAIEDLDSNVFSLKEKIDGVGIEIYKLQDAIHALNINLERIATAFEMKEYTGDE